MKKIIFLFIFLLVITSCNNNTDTNSNDKIEIDDINNDIENIDDSFPDYSLDDIEQDLDSI